MPESLVGMPSPSQVLFEPLPNPFIPDVCRARACRIFSHDTNDRRDFFLVHSPLLDSRGTSMNRGISKRIEKRLDLSDAIIGNARYALWVKDTISNWADLIHVDHLAGSDLLYRRFGQSYVASVERDLFSAGSMQYFSQYWIGPQQETFSMAKLERPTICEMYSCLYVVVPTEVARPRNRNPDLLILRHTLNDPDHNQHGEDQEFSFSAKVMRDNPDLVVKQLTAWAEKTHKHKVAVKHPYEGIAWKAADLQRVRTRRPSVLEQLERSNA